MTGLNTGEKAGIQTAVADLHDPNQLPIMPAEQLPLLPIREMGQENAAETGENPRGVGRPKGAKNRSTKEWTEYLLGRYRSPLIALAETYSRSIADLAVELGYNLDTITPAQRKELFQLQLQCARELAPYVHQKQPIGLDTGETGLVTLVIGGMPGQITAGVNDPLAGMQIIDVTATVNQELSGEISPESNETQLNESALVEASRGFGACHAADLESAAEERK